MWVAANCSKLLCLASLSTSNSYSLLCFRSSFAKAGVRKPSCVEQNHREVYGCSRTATGHSSRKHPSAKVLEPWVLHQPLEGHVGVLGQLLALCYSQQ